MPEENNEQNLPGDEALARWQARNQNEAALMITGRWGKPSMLASYTLNVAVGTAAVEWLYAKWQNECGSEETDS